MICQKRQWMTVDDGSCLHWSGSWGSRGQPGSQGRGCCQIEIWCHVIPADWKPGISWQRRRSCCKCPLTSPRAICLGWKGRIGFDASPRNQYLPQRRLLYRDGFCNACNCWLPCMLWGGCHWDLGLYHSSVCWWQHQPFWRRLTSQAWGALSVGKFCWGW